MNRKLLILILFVVVGYGFAGRISNVVHRRDTNPVYRSFVDKVAHHMGSYLDKLIPVKEAKTVVENVNDCDTMDEIENYFLKVYSSNTTDNISSDDLDDLISYQVRKSKSKTAQDKTKKYRCNRQTCFQSQDIIQMLNITTVTRENLGVICPILLYNMELDSCLLSKQQTTLDRYLIWIIGLTFTTVSTLWSWIGCLVLPIMGRPVYKKVLTGIISLAFGCLLSNSLLNFIPRSDGFESIGLERPNTTFFFKHIVILSVILLLFNFERVMKLIAFYKKEQVEKRREKEKLKNIKSICEFKVGDSNEINEVKTNVLNNNNVKLLSYKNNCQDSFRKIKNETKCKHLKKIPSIDIADVHILGMPSLNEVTDNIAPTVEKMMNEESKIKKRICCASLTKGLSKVRPIGWMAICGDGLSNFIDGLTIGASINGGFTAGLTVTIPVWLGNIPQELGDFALLIRAGMTPFQALFYNYISALGAYVGFVVGCIAGENLLVARWIFAVSGATTMYIALAVLLPEIVEEFESIKPFIGKLKITIIQITGLVIGYSILTLLNIYEEEISI